MSLFGAFFQSAVGKKAVMAVSGLILFGFVLGHLIGNLKLYLGREAINEYAEFLRHVGEPAVPGGVLLWIARLVLLAAVGLHIWAAWQVTRMSRAARPSDYAKRDAVQASYASRTMRWGGVILVVFIVYHLLHFTTGTAHPEFIPGDVYANVVTGFQNPLVSAFYVLAQVALGFHLYHGLWSLFQSLGWNHPRFNHWRLAFAHAFAWIVTIGNLSFPLAVLAGLIPL